MALVDSLLSAALGGLIGTSGTLLAWRTQAREARRTRGEQYRREDSFRLHAERVAAYHDFYMAAGHARGFMQRPHTEDMVAEARREIWDGYPKLVIVAEEGVLRVASEILSYMTGVAHEGEEFDLEEYKALIRKYQFAIRADIIGADLQSSQLVVQMDSRAR